MGPTYSTTPLIDARGSFVHKLLVITVFQTSSILVIYQLFLLYMFSKIVSKLFASVLFHFILFQAAQINLNKYVCQNKMATKTTYL